MSTGSKYIYIERKTEDDFSNRKALEEAILSFPKGKRLEVRVKTLTQRSDQQNRYFHACVGIMANELGYDKEEMKEIVKYKFLLREKVDERTGELFKYIAETHKLNKEDFYELQQNLIRWAAELGIHLPTPQEQTEMPI